MIAAHVPRACDESMYYATSSGVRWLVGMGSMQELEVVHGSQNCFCGGGEALAPVTPPSFS